MVYPARASNRSAPSVVFERPAPRSGLLSRAKSLLREWKDFKRLFSDSDEARAERTLCFYSERDIYYRYFAGYIDYVLEHSDLDVCYITSDPADPVFESANSRIKVYYIKNLLAATLSRLDGRALVMTMPDLGLSHVQRSRHPVNHVYLFHGVGSVHLQYNKKAFDAYDTIFCLGPYDRREIRRAEELYELPRKELVETGYWWVEKIFRDHQARGRAPVVSNPPRVLVAPSWHDENLLALHLVELVLAFDGSPYLVTIRPHPETLKRRWDLIESIQKLIRDRERLTLELDMVSGTSLHEADVLITDWSAISFEYAFGTERPVLFVDTPCKIHNPDYRELGIEPIEFSTRAEIGRSVAPEQLPELTSIVEDFLTRREHYRLRIVDCRERTLSNWLSSDRVGGERLLALCRNGSGDEPAKERTIP